MEARDSIAGASKPRSHQIAVDGAEICVFEWGRPKPGEPTIVLAHATGFHARCWDRVIDHLGDDRHVFAIDQRGHGRSDRAPIHHWGVFGRDLVELIEKLDLRDIIGVGHSMGGHAMTDAAAHRPGRFRRLVLIDPVIGPPEAYQQAAARFSPDDPHPTARRRNHFASPEAMIERFCQRPPYANFHPEVLEDYCRFGLLANPDGPGYVLACPPETEASIYASSFSHPDVHKSVSSLALPVLVVRAKEPPPDRNIMDFSSSPTWPGLADAFPQGRELHLTDRTHFLPLETPRYAAELIDEQS